MTGFVSPQRLQRLRTSDSSGWFGCSVGLARRLLGQLVAVRGRFRLDVGYRDGTVQLLVDELADDAVDELGYGAAQLVTDERLERLPLDRGHVRYCLPAWWGMST